MPTWQQLRDAKFSIYEHAADGWGKVSNRADAARTRVEQEMAMPIRGSQKGEASSKAQSDLTQLSRNYQYIHGECGLVRTTLNGLATELIGAQRKLKEALEEAEHLKFTVNPDGSVTYPIAPTAPSAPGKGTATPGFPTLPDQLPPGRPIPGLLLPGQGAANDANQGKAENIAERIAQAVKEAAEIDARYARTLRRLKAPPGLTVTDDMLVDVEQDTRAVRQTVGQYVDKDAIPHEKSPAENRKWWDSLTAEQRDQYAALYPAEIGALDGLPTTVRDSSNRLVLAETRAQVQQQLAALGPEPVQNIPDPSGKGFVSNPDWIEWNRKGGTRLRDQLKGMDAIQARFDASGVPDANGKGALPEAYLLGFDTKGLGHAIVANGNPDTADHTAVYVPGTEARLGRAEGDIKRMTDLWREADAQAPGESTSTITWIGYDAPQNVLTDSPRASYAFGAAPKLNGFLDGLQTVQGGADASHTTVIAHSYGTTVVGEAAQIHRIAADDLVVAGSPGMLVGDASDLDVGRGHVWSEAADDDPVPYIGRPFLGGHKLGVQTWHGIPYEAGYITTVPSDEAFGGHRMNVNTSGHSGYWDTDSTSLKNQARVVVGQYHLVEEAN